MPAKLIEWAYLNNVYLAEGIQKYKQIIYMTPKGSSWQEEIEGSGHKVDALASSSLNGIPTVIVNDIRIKEVKIYPNPVTDVINIETPQEIKSIQVLSTKESLVLMEEPNSPKVLISTASFVSGIYFVKIELASGEVIIKKILK